MSNLVSKFLLAGNEIEIADRAARTSIDNLNVEVEKLKNSAYQVYAVNDVSQELGYIAIVINRKKVNVGIVNNNGSLSSSDAVKSVLDFMQTSTADIAVNCDYFPSKMALNGVILGTEDRKNVLNYLAYNPTTADFKIYPLGTPFANIISAGYTYIMGVSWTLLENGSPSDQPGQNETSVIDPRTTFGWADDRFVIICNLGRRPGYKGITPQQQREIAGKYGCTTAVNLDGGGSMQLCVKVNGMVQEVTHNYDGGVWGVYRKVPLNINFTEV